MATDIRKNTNRYQRYFLNIKAIYSTRQDIRMFLEILLSIIAVAFFVFFAIKPTILTIGKLLTEIKEKENIVSQLDTKITNLQIAQQLYIDNASTLEVLNLAIPDTAQPEGIIRQIEAISQNNNLEILKITAEDIDLVGANPTPIVSKIPGFRSMKISFIASGSYTDVVNFIKDTSNMRRPLHVKEIIVNSSAANKEITVSTVAEGIYFDLEGHNNGPEN